MFGRFSESLHRGLRAWLTIKSALWASFLLIFYGVKLWMSYYKVMKQALFEHIAPKHDAVRIKVFSTFVNSLNFLFLSRLNLRTRKNLTCLVKIWFILQWFSKLGKSFNLTLKFCEKLTEILFKFNESITAFKEAFQFLKYKIHHSFWKRKYSQGCFEPYLHHDWMYNSLYNIFQLLTFG